MLRAEGGKNGSTLACSLTSAGIKIFEPRKLENLAKSTYVRPLFLRVPRYC